PIERDIARPTEIAREAARLARAVLGEKTEVLWFGSWPQGKALPHSDIDLAISIGAAIAPERMALLQEALDELPTLYQVDVVDLNAVGPALREEILKHGERL
ncbi:MAG: nucleotidyltransferase domain-containing protein, partial [Candidatus Binatia bacterium]